MTASAKRIGIFGGTFDPVHLGHIASARELATKAKLDTVYLMPCYRHPHDKHPGASAVQRLEMLELALANEKNLAVDSRELHRSGLSYTVDSMAEIRSEQGDDAVLVFILGSDAFAGLDTWYRWQSLLEQASLLVIERAGQIALNDIDKLTLQNLLSDSVEEFNKPAGQLMQLRLKPYDISSTAIRQALAAGKTATASGDNAVGDNPANKRIKLREYIPDLVMDYVQANHLYGL
jgi:nicotinate-nucleotide adenylyltransferase